MYLPVTGRRTDSVAFLFKKTSFGMYTWIRIPKNSQKYSPDQYKKVLITSRKQDGAVTLFS